MSKNGVRSKLHLNKIIIFFLMFQTDALVHNLKTEKAHISNELQRLSQELAEQGLSYQNCLMQIQTMQDQINGRNEYVINMEVSSKYILN